MNYDIIYVIIYVVILRNSDILYAGIGYWIYCYFRRRYHMCYDSNIYYQSVSKEEISSEARVSNGSCFFRDFYNCFSEKEGKGGSRRWQLSLVLWLVAFVTYC